MYFPEQLTKKKNPFIGLQNREASLFILAQHFKHFAAEDFKKLLVYSFLMYDRGKNGGEREGKGQK